MSLKSECADEQPLKETEHGGEPAKREREKSDGRRSEVRRCGADVFDDRHGIAKMFLYNLSLQKSSAVVCAALGNFSGQKQQEIIVSRGTFLELLRPDPSSGKVVSVLVTDVFGHARSLAAFRLTGSSKGVV